MAEVAQICLNHKAIILLNFQSYTVCGVYLALATNLSSCTLKFNTFPLEHTCIILACFLHHSHWCHLHNHYINHMYVSWLKGIYDNWAFTVTPFLNFSHSATPGDTMQMCISCGFLPVNLWHLSFSLSCERHYHYIQAVQHRTVIISEGIITWCLHIVKNPRPVVHFCKWSWWKQTWFLHFVVAINLHLQIHCRMSNFNLKISGYI